MFILYISLLVFNLNLMHCLFEIQKILDLNYFDLKCDFDYYTILKRNPLHISYSFERDQYDYLIANHFILKRSTLTHRIQYAEHSVSTSELNLLLSSSDTIIQFDDAIEIWNLTVQNAGELFHSIKFINKTHIDLGSIESVDLIGKQYFYYSIDSLIRNFSGYDFFVKTNLGSKTRIAERTQTGFYSIDNPKDKLKIKIDAIHCDRSNESQTNVYRLIEYSNSHGISREYHISSNQQIIDSEEHRSTINYLTYHNLLNCLVPLCEGGRVRGLITVKQKYLFFFLEDHYIQISGKDIFKADDNHTLLDKIKNYKNVRKIRNFPYGGLVSYDRFVYAQNLYFKNEILAVIQIDDLFFFLDYDESIDDLIIRHQIFEYNLTNAFLTVIRSNYPLDPTVNHQIVAIQENGFFHYSSDYVRNRNSSESSEKKNRHYRFPFGSIESERIDFAAITSYDSKNTVTITFYSTHSFNYTIHNYELDIGDLFDSNKSLESKDSRLARFDFNLLECRSISIERRLRGEFKEIQQPDNREEPTFRNILLIVLVVFIITGVLFAAILIYYIFKFRQFTRRIVINPNLSSSASSKEPIFLYKNSSVLSSAKVTAVAMTAKVPKVFQIKPAKARDFVMYDEFKKMKDLKKLGNKDRSYLRTLSSDSINTISTIKSNISDKDSRELVKFDKLNQLKKILLDNESNMNDPEKQSKVEKLLKVIQEEVEAKDTKLKEKTINLLPKSTLTLSSIISKFTKSRTTKD